VLEASSNVALRVDPRVTTDARAWKEKEGEDMWEVALAPVVRLPVVQADCLKLGRAPRSWWEV
jgi:hypothetical protein